MTRATHPGLLLSALLLLATTGTGALPLRSAAAGPGPGGGGGFGSGHGAFFRPPVNVSHSLGQSRFARVSPHSLVLDPVGPLFVIWVEVLPHTEGIAHEMATCRYLANAGWDSTYTPIWLWEGNPSTEPAAVLDRGRVLHLVWVEQQDELRMVMGLRFGVTTGMISTADAISGPLRTVADPDAAVDLDGQMHVVWSEVEHAAPRLRHRRWTAAAEWNEAEILATGAGEGAFSPAVVCSEDGVLTVAWQRTHGRSGAIVCAALGQDGRLSAPEVVSNERAGWFTGAPAVAVSASGVWIAWSETDGVESRVQARKKMASGWQPILTLSVPGALAEHPSLAVDAWEALHAVWIERGAGGDRAGSDLAGGTSGGGAVVYTCLDLEASAPAAPPRSMSVGGTGPFENPIIAADRSGRVAAAWVDRGVGNGDIFVRQGFAGFAALPALGPTPAP